MAKCTSAHKAVSQSLGCSQGGSRWQQGIRCGKGESDARPWSPARCWTHQLETRRLRDNVLQSRHQTLEGCLLFVLNCFGWACNCGFENATLEIDQRVSGCNPRRAVPTRIRFHPTT